MPKHPSVIINLDEDSSDDEHVSPSSSGGFLGSLNDFLKEARQSVEAQEIQDLSKVKPEKTTLPLNRGSGDKKQRMIAQPPIAGNLSESFASIQGTNLPVKELESKVLETR